MSRRPTVARPAFTETMRIGQLAAAHQVTVSPHVVHELSLHVAAALPNAFLVEWIDRKSTRLNSSHIQKSRMPSSA